MEPERGVERLGFIEGLRGVAVGVVMVFHATAWARVGRPWSDVLSFGHAGVDLFFVISGFCMLWPVLRDGRIGSLSAGAFLRRRALRIGPPYLVALGVVLATSLFMWKAGGPSWWGAQPMQSIYPATAGDFLGNLGSHVTFTHGLINRYDRSFDGAFWSLSTEWQFYLLLPVLLLIVHRFGLRAAIAITVMVPVVYVVAVHQIDPMFRATPIGTDNIAYRLVEFGAGMLAAWLVSARRTSPMLMPATVVVGAVALRVDHWGPVVATPFAYAAFFGLLAVLCAQRGRLRTAAESRPLRSLGRISYSAYLIHGSVFMLVAVPLTAWEVPQSVRVAAELLVALPLAVAAAVLMHRAVERPAVAWASSVRGVNHRPAPVS